MQWKNAYVGWMVVLCLATMAGGAAAPVRPARLEQVVRDTVAATLDQLEKDGDFIAAQSKLIDTFDQVIAFVPKEKLEPFGQTAFALRLVGQLQPLPPSQRTDMLKYLRANNELAWTLVFLVRSCNKPQDVYALLDRLRQQHAKEVRAFPSLAAALCVVHDRPLVRAVNENRVTAPDALAIFDYYVKHEAGMALPIRALPAELLLHLVDITVTIDEMNWALSRYAGMRNVGPLYSSIKYDYDALATGRTKRLTVEGFNLPNILTFGGICADQAYFASAVGKAIGVPTSISRGNNESSGHAWMGYFQLANRRGWWDFETGLYDGYRDVQGQVIDPQTHKWIPQTYVELQAELADTTPQSRQTARALADAVRRMMDLEKQGKSLPAEAPVGWPSLLTANKFRKANVTAELELTELAVRLSPGDRLAWEPLPELAAAGKLTPAMKKYWGNVLQSVCGVKYLDFVVAVLIPMVRSESDVQEQERLWNWLFGVVVSRPGLAVRVRMEQAAMWEARGLAERAGQCYVDVIERYATAGPFVIDALQKEEKILRASGKPDRVLALYDTTWMRLKPPVQGRWMGKQSNWYRVGMLLADQLDQATRIQQAASLRTILAQQLQQD